MHIKDKAYKIDIRFILKLLKEAYMTLIGQYLPKDYSAANTALTTSNNPASNEANSKKKDTSRERRIFLAISPELWRIVGHFLDNRVDSTNDYLRCIFPLFRQPLSSCSLVSLNEDIVQVAPQLLRDIADKLDPDHYRSQIKKLRELADSLSKGLAEPDPTSKKPSQAEQFKDRLVDVVIEIKKNDRAPIKELLKQRAKQLNEIEKVYGSNFLKNILSIVEAKETFNLYKFHSSRLQDCAGMVVNCYKNFNQKGMAFRWYDVIKDNHIAIAAEIKRAANSKRAPASAPTALPSVIGQIVQIDIDQNRMVNAIHLFNEFQQDLNNNERVELFTAFINADLAQGHVQSAEIRWNQNKNLFSPFVNADFLKRLVNKHIENNNLVRAIDLIKSNQALCDPKLILELITAFCHKLTKKMDTTLKSELLNFIKSLDLETQQLIVENLKEIPNLNKIVEEIKAQIDCIALIKKAESQFIAIISRESQVSTVLGLLNKSDFTENDANKVLHIAKRFSRTQMEQITKALNGSNKSEHFTKLAKYLTEFQNIIVELKGWLDPTLVMPRIKDLPLFLQNEILLILKNPDRRKDASILEHAALRRDLEKLLANSADAIVNAEKDYRAIIKANEAECQGIGELFIYGLLRKLYPSCMKKSDLPDQWLRKGIELMPT